MRKKVILKEISFCNRYTIAKMQYTLNRLEINNLKKTGDIYPHPPYTTFAVVN
jgi:hypothetical protein